MVKPQTLKGFRDFLPYEARKRQYVVDIFKQVFQRYGFEPLETPALEYEALLTGKYGDEGEKLLYRFEDHGKRHVALRYDQTVPLARVVAQYQNELVLPFKRYQIQNVWRADNTQKGRFREFIQCDVDAIGTSSPLADSELLSCVHDSLRALGFTDFTILVNSRKIFEHFGATQKIISILDKKEKIGEEKMVEELSKLMDSHKNAEDFVNKLKNISDEEIPNGLKEILKKKDDLHLSFSPFLARGIDYYTDLIFEVTIPSYTGGSVCGGGRYDNLIGIFAGKQIPAVGFAFGFDRIIDAMNELQLFPPKIQTATTKVLVTIFDESLTEKALEVCSHLRSNNINTEIYLGTNIKMEKQLKYADQKGIPFASIIGPEEVEKNMITIKDFKKRTQQQMSIDELIFFFKNTHSD